MSLPESPSLICGQMKISFAALPGERKLGYQLFVSDEKSDWRPVSAPHNPLVRGNPLTLLPDAVEQDGPNALRLRGPVPGPRAPLASWSGTIQADANLGWFVVDIVLKSEA